VFSVHLALVIHVILVFVHKTSTMKRKESRGIARSRKGLHQLQDDQ
jgi:hypothetical protein